MDFSSFNQSNDTFIANVNRVEKPFLPPGSYTLAYDQNRGELHFKKFNPNYDQIIDLPSPEYDEIMKEVNEFLSPDARQRFIDYNYLYKRSIFLWGGPGTGKTIIVNRVGEKVVQRDGVIIFNPHPALLKMAFKILDDVQPNMMTMVIFEEFEKLLEEFEEDLLSLLDGEIQKPNVMYLATTNHFDLIPARLKRPGRFPTIMQVHFPSADARHAYLSKKLKESDVGEIPNWVKATDGLSIDELKETVLAVKCLRKPLKDVVQRIKEVRRLAKDAEDGTGDWESPKNQIGRSKGFTIEEALNLMASQGMKLKKG